MSVRNRPRTALTTCLAIAALTGAACGGSGGAGSQGKSTALPANTSEACTKGQQEGQLNYWRSGDQDVLDKEMEPFRQKYPKIKIKIGLYRPNEITQRMSAEAQAGHAPTPDAIEGDLPSLDPVLTSGLVRDVDWSTYGVASNLITTAENVHAIRTYRIPGGLGYNTKQVKPEDLPDTWDGVVDSKWSGKIIYDPRGSYLQNLAAAWGYDKAAAWFDKFMKSDKPVPVQGSTSSLEQVASGQHPVTTSATGDNVARMQAQGAPIAIKYLDVVPTLDYYAMLVKGAAHPNAAVCFIQWWTSPEAIAKRLEVDYMTNDDTPKGVPAGATVISLTTPDDAAAATKFASKIAADSQ